MLVTKVFFVQLFVHQQLRFSALVHRYVGAIDQSIVERLAQLEIEMVHSGAHLALVLLEENETVVVQAELMLQRHIAIAVHPLVLVGAEHATDEEILKDSKCKSE